MAKEKKNIFLGKHGKTAGPFSASEIEQLTASGEIQNYAYVWEPDTSSWKPIEAPPPHPVVASPTQKSKHSLEALCHDSVSSLVRGVLKNVSETGCDLVTKDDADSPCLGLKRILHMNVLEPVSGKSINVKIRLNGISREEGNWIYELQWLDSSSPLLFA